MLAKSLPVHVLTEVQRILKPVLLSGATFEQIESQVTALYNTKKLVSFLSRRQEVGESIVRYGGSLNQLTSQCKYKDCCRDTLVHDVFISGLRSVEVMASLISECENKTFSEVLDKAKLVEQIQQDVVEINPSAKQFRQNAIQQQDNITGKKIPNKNFSRAKTAGSN